MPLDGEDNDLSSYHERRLNEFKDAVAHPELAIAGAMHYCAELGLTPPEWLTKAAANLICQLLKSQRTTVVGRSRGAIPRYRQEMVHVDRWLAVHAVRDIAWKVRRDQKILKKEGVRYPEEFRESYQRELDRRSKWLSHGVFVCASMYLCGSESFAGPDAIKASYRKIEQMNGYPADNQSCILEVPFLEKLGIVWDEGKAGKKLLHLFDLTP